VTVFDFDQVFGDDYLHFSAGQLTDERADREVDLIVRLLDLAPGTRVLDIPCGHGRISSRLAARGCDVVGVDRSEAFLAVARRDASGVDYRRADMRTFSAEAEFDRIVNWYTSFGYFDDTTDRATLAGWRRALRPGGRLLIDHPNRQHLLRLIAASRQDRATVLVERGDDLLIDVTTFEEATGRSHTERIGVRDGRVHRSRFSVRTFAFTELRDWLLEAGFSRVEGYDQRGESLRLDSGRMIVVATA
jgi:SAM-dependent methyltransferase